MGGVLVGLVLALGSASWGTAAAAAEPAETPSNPSLAPSVTPSRTPSLAPRSISSSTPRSTAVDPALAARAAEGAEPGDPCRAWVTRDLTDGVRHRGEREALCAPALEVAQRRLLRSQRPRPVFGVLERRVDDLVGVSFVLSAASWCWRWPLRADDQPSPGVTEVAQGGCRFRRYEGPLVVTAVDAAGRRARVMVARPDSAGRLRIRFADVDRALRLAGSPPLHGWARLEFGEGGWAGEVDLAALQGVAADRHADWVRRGRGVPALFVLTHGDHPAAAEVQGLADEALILRQGADYQAVVDGRFPPRRFLDRYAISRFRGAVEALELAPAPATPGASAEDELRETTP